MAFGKHFFKKNLAAFALAFTFVPTSISACQTESEINLQNLRFADVVFRGEVIGYEKIVDPSVRARYGVIQFKVLETLMGEQRSKWEMAWENSTYALPDTWEHENVVYVAGLWADASDETYDKGWHGASNDIRPDLLHVLQAACSKPFFLSNNNDSFEQLERTLNENFSSHDN